ncbi:MAG TPA: hypothetical protein VMD74_03665 [Candidatus Methylomirabilis sp.]|nr:hypothetical protein [Candidatus Methylomirabilis sp.]
METKIGAEYAGAFLAKRRCGAAIRHFRLMRRRLSYGRLIQGTGK